MIKRMDVNDFCKMLGCKNKKHLLSKLRYLKEVYDFSWYFNDDNGVEVILIDYKNSIYIVRSRLGCYLKREYETACEYFSKGLSFDLNPKLEYVIDMVETYGYALLNSGQAQAALAFEGIYDNFYHRFFFYLT